MTCFPRPCRLAGPGLRLFRAGTVVRIHSGSPKRICLRARAFTMISIKELIDDSRVNGVSQSTISEKDAFVKISTVDAKFLYFAGQYYYLKKEINIEFKQETEIPYSNFEINETIQYSALEIDGRSHTVCSEVKNNGSHFSINVQPMPASDLAMG